MLRRQGAHKRKRLIGGERRDPKGAGYCSRSIASEKELGISSQSHGVFRQKKPNHE